MKKLSPVVLIICLLMCLQSSAQFSFRFGTGYAWPGFYNSENVMAPAVNSKTPTEDGLAPMANNIDKIGGGDSINKKVYGSYGQGFNFTVGLGYKINRFFGVDLGISYLKSGTISCTQYNELYLNNPGFGYSATNSYLKIKISTQATGLSLSPSIVVTGDKKHWKVYPYVRAGIILPVAGKSTQNMGIDIDSGLAKSPVINKAPYFLGAHTQVTLQTQGEVSLGVNGAIGIAYQPFPFLNVFIEANGQYLNVRAKSAQITQWDADGVSEIAARGVYRTQFTFVDQLTKTSNNSDYNPNTNTNQPKQDVRPSAPFSNIGLNVGFTLFLGRKTLTKQKEKDKNATQPASN